MFFTVYIELNWFELNILFDSLKVTIGIIQSLQLVALQTKQTNTHSLLYPIYVYFILFSQFNEDIIMLQELTNCCVSRLKRMHDAYYSRYREHTIFLIALETMPAWAERP